MSTATDLFVEEARAVTLAEAVGRLGIAGLKGAGASELVGPCPACGGTDRFQVARGKEAWLCRGAAEGRDALSLAAHVLEFDLRRREDFLSACAAVTGRPVPDGAEESDADRSNREARLAELRRSAEAKAAREAASSADFRERERAKARGKWRAAGPGCRARAYLALRLGLDPADLPDMPFLRDITAEAYWHGKDERGHAVSLHDGPAIVAPFVDPEGEVIGCHLTWLDLRQGPKFRPRIQDEAGASLPTKKMRGTKKGGLIPLIGFGLTSGLILPDLRRTRFVAGEAIENTVAIAVAEGARADTLYCAAGDLGNLAGPADPGSSFAHPVLTTEDKAGRKRPVRVSGPEPKAGQGAGDAMQVPEHVTEVVLVADGDSELVMTASAITRAEMRIARPGRVVGQIWPSDGADFAGMMRGSEAA